jgi:hypothetical protein
MEDSVIVTEPRECRVHQGRPLIIAILQRDDDPLAVLEGKGED